PRDSELSVLWAHVHEPPPTSTEYPSLDPVIAKALAKDPAERYASCREVVDSAREALGLHDVVVVRDRRPILIAVAGAVLAAGALAGALALTLGGGGSERDLTVRPNTVVRIDPATNKVAAVIDVGRGPESVAVGGDTLWVHNWSSETVSKVDLHTGS